MLQFLFFTWLAVGHEAVRPSHPNHLLNGTMVDIGYPVPTASVVAFNRPRLEFLYPRLRGLSDNEMRTGILKECAVINSKQLALTSIRNRHIRHTVNDAKPLFISPGAGRGAEVEAFGGLVNLKASGNSSWNQLVIDELLQYSSVGLTEAARLLDHSSGLEVFWVAAAEYLRHFQLQMEFDELAEYGGPRLETVEPLFLIDYGFDVNEGDEWVRAFLIGREPHFGRLIASTEGATAETTTDLYKDYGKFQTTYSGARIDFGGSRLRNEANEDWQVRARRAGAERMPEFIAEELSRMRLRPVTKDRPPPRNPPGLLATFNATHERFVDSAVMGQGWIGYDGNRKAESPEMTRLKWRLNRYRPETLVRKLEAFDDEALINLLKSSKGVLKMPLPRAAYEHAFQRDREVRGEAAAAALHVVGRYPSLIPYVVDEVEEEMERTTRERPLPFVKEILTAKDSIPEISGLLISACRSENWYVQRIAERHVRRLLNIANVSHRRRLPRSDTHWQAACAEKLTH